MAKKKAKPRLNRALMFRKEWIFDPGPDILHLDRAAVAKVNQLKTAFTKNVNSVITKAQG